VEGKRSSSRVAAEQLLNLLQDIRAHPHDYLPKLSVTKGTAAKAIAGRVPIGSVTKWTKELFRLSVPMTKRNYPDWWKVARFLLCEQWDQNRAAFSFLIKDFLLEEYLKPPKNKPSKVRSRIIDQMIKPEFKTLAI
jgi:hypothetical protein